MRNHCPRGRRERLYPGREPALAARLFTGSVKWAAFLAAGLVLHSACAQVSGSASVTSEYSQRGRSLSKGRMAPQLRLDYDGASGWYGGALLSRAALADSDASAQLVAYGGYTRQLAPGTSWEAGVLDASFAGDDEYHYHEFYAGLSRDRLAGRVYFSPSYYGGGKTIYGELNGSWPLRERLALVAHIGLLHPFSSDHEEDRQRVDLRIGLGYDIGAWSLQLAWIASGPRRQGADEPRALAVSASWGF